MKNIKSYILMCAGALLLVLGFLFPNEDPVLGRIMNPTPVGTAPAVGDLNMAGYDITNGGEVTFATGTASMFNKVVTFGTGGYASTAAGMNAAITYLADTYGGGIIEFPCGEYTIAPETVTFRSNITLRGHGECTKINMGVTASAARLFIVGTSTDSRIRNVTIENIYLSNENRNPLSTTPDANTRAVAANYTDNLTIRNVRTEQFYTPIRVTNSTNFVADRNVELSGYGTALGGYGAQNHINVENTEDWVLSNNISYVNDTAYRIQGGRRGRVTGNTLRYSGIEIGNAESRGYSKDIAIIGNSFEENRTNAINLVAFSEATGQRYALGEYNSAVDDIKVIGNTFRFGDDGNPAALIAEADSIYFSSTTAISNVTFADNTVISTSTGAVSTAGVIGIVNSGSAPYWNIHNNNMYGLMQEGFRFSSLKKSVISNNNVTGYNAENAAGGARYAACVYLEGTASSSASFVRISDNACDAHNTTSASGVYFGSSSYLNDILLSGNTILNASSTTSFTDSAPSYTSVWNEGSLGIGTTTPAYKLGVNGTLGVTGVSTILDDLGIGKAPAYRLDVTDTDANGPANFTTTAQAFAYGLTMGTVGNAAANRGTGILFNVPGSSNAVEGANIKVANKDNINNAYFAISTRNSGTVTETIRIVDGRVGIGTTTPATKLDVYNSTATSSAYIYSGGAGLGGRLILEDTDGAGCTEVTALDGTLTAQVVTCP